MNKLIPLFERLLSLLVVFLLLAGTVVWTGTLFGRHFGQSSVAGVMVTATPSPDTIQMEKLGLAGAELTVADSASWVVRDAAGNVTGRIIGTEPYARDVMGYAGVTPLYLYVSNDSVIKSVVAADNDESPSFFRSASEGIFEQLVGEKVADVAAKRVDAVSGATFSSVSLIENVKNTLQARAASQQTQKSAPVIGWGKTLAVLAVLLAGILVAWRCRGVKWLRLVVLVLNVGVTGFWCGQFLSLSVVRGWVQNGLDPLLYLPGLALLLVAIVLPYFGRSHHYCQWVCPYGSLQELVWYIPVKKLRLSPDAYQLMRLAKLVILMLLLIALWFGAGVWLLDYEPFSAFVLTTATPVVIVLAALFVILGMFVPRFWCRAICPIGTLLELAQDGGRKNKTKPATSPQTDVKDKTPSAPSPVEKP